MNPLMVSRVGADSRGARILQKIRSTGMDCRAIQIDPERPTGVVQVTLDEGVPRYEIRPDAAWDFINWEELEPCLSRELRPGLICAGTLALRSPASRDSFDQLVGFLSAGLLLDLNLRAPWCSSELVTAQIQRARWLKLNDEELDTVLGHEVQGPNVFSEQAAAVCRELGLELLAVTFGAEGAVLATREEAYCSPSPAVEAMVDTVGAGDGFTAAVIRGIQGNQPVPAMLNSAVEFATRICGIRGATPAERSFYQATG
jgi:fructokinase